MAAFLMVLRKDFKYAWKRALRVLDFMYICVA
jgi:hypothetical protein